MSSDYTLLRAADVPDYTGGTASPFLGYGRPLGTTQVALNIRELAPGEAHVPPGGDPAGGHSHKTIEEIYLLLEGEVTMKVGDDVVTLGPRDAIRMAAGVPRATRNDGSAKAALLMVSMRTEDPRAESVVHEGFWPESART
jgi:uncharacterized cupin superfamily protein